MRIRGGSEEGIRGGCEEGVRRVRGGCEGV